MSKRIQLEKEDEQKFCDWVEEQGGRAYKWEGSRYKLDRVVVTHTGHVMLFEFKEPGGGRLSAHQTEIITHSKARSLILWNREPDSVVVVSSFSEACNMYFDFVSHKKGNGGIL